MGPGSIWLISESSPKFCCEPESTLKKTKYIVYIIYMLLYVEYVSYNFYIFM